MNAKRGMVSVVLAAATAVTVCATDRTWDGGAADSNFSKATNWDGDTLPAFDGTDRAVFGTGGATATVDTGVSLSGITFNRDAAFTVANGAGSLTLGAGGLSALLPSTTSRTYQIQEDVTFAANQVWSLTNNGAGVATVEVSGTLGDGDSDFSLTKSGNGTLVLSGSNTYDGITTVEAGGPLRVTHGNALGSTNGATSVKDYGWLELSGGVTVPEPISLSGADVNTNFRGALRSMDGSNVLTGVLSGGPRISCKAGSLHILGGFQPGGTVIDAAGGSYIRIAEKPINFGANQVPLYGTALLIIDVTNNVWGNLLLSGATVRTDRENVLATGGTLSMGGNNMVNVLNLNGKNQTVWSLSCTSTNGSHSINSSTPATLTVNQSATTEFKGAFTGAAGLVKTGTGALTLSGASTLSGAVIVSNGTLLVTGTLGANCTNVAVAGGTLTISNSTALSDNATVQIADGATMTLAGGVSETVNMLFLNGEQQVGGSWGAYGSGASHEDGHFAGTGKLTVQTSPPIVPVAVTWDGEGGDTLFSTATNWVGDTAPAFDGATHAVFGTGGTTATVDTAASLYGMVFNRDADFTVAGGAGGVTLGAGGLVAVPPSATSRTYRVEEDLVFVENQVWGITNNGAGAATLEVSGSLGDGVDSFSLTQAGNGTLVLSGNNAYDGATTVKTTAVLRVTHDNALGSTNGATIVEDGGRLILSGGITVRDNLSLYGDKSTGFSGVLWSTGGTNVLRGKVLAGTRIKCLDGQLDLLGGSASPLIAAASPGGCIRIAENPVNGGGGTFFAHTVALLILDVTNNVWGTMEAAGLTSVRTDRANVLPPASTLRLAEGTTVVFDMNGQNQTIGKLECAVAGNYFLCSASPATLTVNQGSASEFKGSVTGAVSLVKSGTGALTLSGANTLSGAAVVSNGTLLVTGAGTLGAACTNVVVAGGTLTLSNSVAIADTAALNIANGGSAKVNLAGGVNETVGFLYFAGRQQRAGTYSAVSGGGVQVVDAIHFAGTGILRVLHDNAGTVISLR